MKKFTQQLFLLGCLLFGVAQLQAQATLSVQGTVQNFNGTAVDNGNYDLTFKLYTVATAGTAIWTETQTLRVTNGVYSVLLGAVNPLNVPFDVPYFLGTTMPDDPEELRPRTPMTSSPYALSLIGQDNVVPSTGNVGIGTNTPAAKLDVNGSIATEERITTATTVAVAAQDHVIFLDHTANQNITLPAAAASEGRHLVLVNKEAVAKTLTASNYLDVITGATSTTIPGNSVVELQSDGSVWRQTGGYVKPGASAKAFVHCTGAGHSVPNATNYTASWIEVTDTGNNFDGTTFTAPRTGVYHVMGQIVGGQVAASSQAVSSVRVIGTCLLCNTINDHFLVYSHYTPPGTHLFMPFSGAIYMTAGQTFSIRWLHQMGVTQSYAANTSQVFLTINEN